MHKASAWLLFIILASGVGLRSQVVRPSGLSTESGGVIQGVITTQKGSIPLGGVVVELAAERNAELVHVYTEGDGTFRFEGLRSGRYQVSAVLEGFEKGAATVEVVWNQITAVPFDLRLAASEEVDVVATAGSGVSDSGTLTAGDTIDSRELEQLAPTGGLQAALRLLISVIEVPGGVSIKGGLPNQSTVQLGPGTFVDPATGLQSARLPDDAIDSVRVLPNPYAVEFGRFSSGLVLIETRRAEEQWKTRLNNLDPTFRTRRHAPFDVEGIAGFAPRVETGGPLVADRLFLQQSAQYRYRSSDVPSRPQTDLRRSHGFSSFTRVDANLAPRHSLVASGGVFPSLSKSATLGTFTPPEATVDLYNNITTTAVTERAVWSDSLFTETTVDLNRYRVEVNPQGRLPMQLFPGTTEGNFYNTHERTTSTFQLIETLSGSAVGRGGLHLFKAGVDLLHNRYASASRSRPVLIRRPDGTLARRLDFGPGRTQAIASTDLAIFAQDRMQPTNRWYVEFGGRLDRDGVIERWNVTPRIGSAVLLDEEGSAVLRSGLGLFFERTPSAAGVFEQYEAFTERRYGADGMPLGGAPMLFEHVTAPDLRTSRSVTWDLAYDHRFNPSWALHVGVIDRRGSRELVVDPVEQGGVSELRLTSHGRSMYREAEIGVQFSAGTAVDLNVSYVRAEARADLNAFTTFFDAVRIPVFGENDYAPARSDVPHRLLAKGRALPTPNWLLVGILDWRSGLPYSVVDAALDYVGPRNAERFPTHVRLELGVEHRVRLFRFRPWIGVRATNALNTWLPTDVQANLASPAFGTFYNSEFRQFRIQVRFER